jgi:hypothetical protein
MLQLLQRQRVLNSCVRWLTCLVGGGCQRPQEADEDGSGELDIEEFCEKLGPHLGGNLTKEQVCLRVSHASTRAATIKL